MAKDLLILLPDYHLILISLCFAATDQHSSDHLLGSAMSHRVTNSSYFLWPWANMEENIPECIPGGFGQCQEL